MSKDAMPWFLISAAGHSLTSAVLESFLMLSSTPTPDSPRRNLIFAVEQVALNPKFFDKKAS